MIAGERLASLGEIEQSISLHPQVRALAAASLAARTGQLAVVGGFVRDMFLGQAPLDIDVVGVGIDEAAARRLAAALDGNVTKVSQFGTYKIEWAEGELDLVNARSETYPKPGALPVVSPGTLHGDLVRRDFSVNAMAATIEPYDGLAHIYDPAAGREDLDLRIIRVLHDESFRDDPTRIVRAARYAVRLGMFHIEPHTWDLMEQAASRHLPAVSPARIAAEMAKTWDGTETRLRAATVFDMLVSVGLFRALAPGMADHDSRADTAMWLFLSALIDSKYTNGEIASAALGLMAETPDTADLLIRKLGIRGTEARILRDTSIAGRVVVGLQAVSVPHSQRRRELAGRHPLAVQSADIATSPTPPSSQVRAYQVLMRELEDPGCPQVGQSCLRGDEVIALGVPRGPQVGAMLNSIVDARLDGELSGDRDCEVAFVRTMLEG